MLCVMSVVLVKSSFDQMPGESKLRNSKGVLQENTNFLQQYRKYRDIWIYLSVPEPRRANRQNMYFKRKNEKKAVAFFKFVYQIISIYISRAVYPRARGASAPLDPPLCNYTFLKAAIYWIFFKLSYFNFSVSVRKKKLGNFFKSIKEKKTSFSL